MNRHYPIALLRKTAGLSFLLGITCLLASPLLAQSDDDFAFKEDGEQSRPFRDNNRNNTSSSTDAPVRLARFSYMEGNVSFRVDEKQAWASA